MATCLPHAKRKFYDFPEKVAQNSTSVCDSTDELIKYIEGNIIGKEKVFSSPYGLRKVVYCDYTASGQSLGFIEDYIREQVLTNYGNTHTTTTVTSLQTSLYRHEARDIIRNAVNASEHDAVIFAGSGCTATVHKLIHAMHLKMSPVVFVGPYEHHSNLLPWRELGAQVVRISQTPDGLIDMLHLETELMKWKSSNKQLIGCFSAASNVTGILSDVNAISSMLHQYGALAFWDYATAGPHVQINMHPVSEVAGDMSKDAVFISTHKFVGGVQTPGVLVAKKSLFKNPVPSNCGGGSVFYVRRNGHRYLQEVEMREEGGTPAIVESVRAGLVFQLKEAVSSQVIMQREDRLCRQALQAWSGCSNLILLGNTTTPRLPVFSFLVRHGANGLFLHHNFVSSLLNDMFGIQTRGGCACAGPYAQDLLGIDEELSEQIETILAEDSRLDRTHLRRYREYSETEILRPGFVRLNLPFFMSDETADFVLTAVKLVAEHGWKMLPQYIFNPETGEWRHRHHQVFKDRKWLGSISYASGHMTFPEPQAPMKGPLPQSLKECLEMAINVFNEASKVRVQLADQTLLFDSSAQLIRWFLLPSEARDHLQNPAAPVKRQPPFTPPDLFVGERRELYERMVTGVTISDSSADIEIDAEKCNKDISGNRRDLQSDNVTCQQPDESVSVISSGAVIRSEENKSNSTVHSPLEADALPNAQAELCVSPQIATSCIVTDSADGQHQTCNSVARQDLSGNQSEGLGNSALEQVQDNSNCLSSGVQVGMISRQSEYTDAVEEVNGQSVPNKGGSKVNRVRRTKWCSPPKKIFKPTVEALEEYAMIRNGDRVLVCLSGGKDSLSLLHCLKQYQFYCKSKGIEFQLGAVTVDPQTSSYDPSPLKQYTASLSVPYFYEEQCILDTASNLPDGCASICSFCSRMKRGRIYACARREGYNVLAMGQHLDDLTESFLMSVFHNGALRTMKANYTVEEGDLRVIRPFVYVREKDLRSFAEQNCLPVIAENCPACFEAPKERHRTKQLLAAQEVLFPNLYSSLMAAMKPLMAVDRTGVDLRKMLGGRGDAMNEVDL